MGGQCRPVNASMQGAAKVGNNLEVSGKQYPENEDVAATSLFFSPKENLFLKPTNGNFNFFTGC